MKTSVKTIRVSIWILVAFFLMSIALSLCKIHCSFVLLTWGEAVAISIFASSLLVLISEYVRYKHMEYDTQMSLYNSLALLYVKLKTIEKETKQCQENPQLQIHKSFLQPQKENIYFCNEKLKELCAHSYSLTDKELNASVSSFSRKVLPQIETLIISLKKVLLTVNEDIYFISNSNLETFQKKSPAEKVNFIEQQPMVSSQSSHTQMALQEVSSLLQSELFLDIESLLGLLSKRMKKMPDWESDKKKIIQMI